MSNKQFKPAWWLPNSHLQTIWPALCRREIKDISLERERLELPDGDFLDLDWLGKDNAGPLVMVLHGFEGSINSHYAKGMLKAIYKQGWRGVFMHFRGCSGEPNRLPRGYHSGETGDIAYLAKILAQREPQTPLAAIGYSLGGNVLLKWLGESGQANPLKAAIAVSVPFELYKAVKRIEQGFSRFYQWHLVKYARNRLLQKFKENPASVDAERLSQVRTIYELDSHYTAPFHGFIDANDYYTNASSRQYLRTIEVPTLVLHAKDDPFMTEEVIPMPNELSQKVILELTETGGHVGFVTGNFPWRAEYWLEQRAPEFLREYL